MHTKYWLSVCVLFISASAVASDRAVEDVHYQAGLFADYFDVNDKTYYDEDEKSVAESLDGRLTVPVGPYLGASISAKIGLYNDEADDGTSEDEETTIRGSAELFYRNPSIGRLSFGYARERTEYTYKYKALARSTKYSGTYTNYSYLTAAEGYVGPVTLGVHNERLFYGQSYYSSYHGDNLFASVQWYVVPRVRVGVQAGFRDAKDMYLAEVEFQPAFLGNMAGIYIGYARSDFEDVEANGVRVGFNFYFNKRFDLITRDRHYR